MGTPSWEGQLSRANGVRGGALAASTLRCPAWSQQPFSADPGLRGSFLPSRCSREELTSPGVPPPGPVRRFPEGGPRGLETGSAPVSEKPLQGTEQRWNHEPVHPSAPGCRASSKQDNR